jgi:hypothetical protein
VNQSQYERVVKAMRGGNPDEELVELLEVQSKRIRTFEITVKALEDTIRLQEEHIQSKQRMIDMLRGHIGLPSSQGEAEVKPMNDIPDRVGEEQG